MNDFILLIMPTRGRPWSALEAIASVMKTADDPSRLFVAVCCDDDDPQKFTLTVNRVLRPVATIIDTRKRFIEWVNGIVEANVIQASIGISHVAWLGDDIRYLTPGWDTIVRSHSELVVYGQDGYQNEKMATHPFIRVDIPMALGYLLPKELIHGCADTFIEALARELESIAYDAKIITEHLHPDAGKSKMDQTYRDAEALWEQDRKTMVEVIMPQIPALAKKVTDYMIPL